VGDEAMEQIDALQDRLDRPDFLDEIPQHRLTEVFVEAYDTLFEKANKEKRAGWRTQMAEVLDPSLRDILYVKNEYYEKRQITSGDPRFFLHEIHLNI